MQSITRLLNTKIKTIQNATNSFFFWINKVSMRMLEPLFMALTLIDCISPTCEAERDKGFIESSRNR